MTTDLLGKMLGSYRILRVLGEGGMGVVFEAVHETIARRVAIKVLNAEYARHPEAAQRFFNEARSVNLIEHPSLVQISDFGQLPNGTAFLVMELLKGENLAGRLRRGGRLPALAALQIGWQIADALCAAHAQKIVHRDLKPENVMLVPDPVAPSGERVKLLDFGIAKVAQGAQTKTISRVIMGTPKYMSPEQCRGAGEVDERTDVYSLGILLFEMLAGQAPFDGDQGELIGSHLFVEPPQLRQLAPDVPPQVASLVHRLLIKDKASRPLMREVQALLTQQILSLGSGALTAAPSSQPPVPLPRPAAQSTLGHSVGQAGTRRRRVRLLGGVLLSGALLTAGLAGWKLRQAATPVHQPQPAAALGTAAFSAPTVKPPPRMQPAEPPARPAASELSPPRLAPAKPPTAPPPAARIRLQVESEPAGAGVFDEAGSRLGTTPWQREQERGQGLLKLHLRLPGYREQSFILRQDQDQIRRERLQPLPRPAPPPSEVRLPEKQREPDKPAPAALPKRKSMLDGVD